MRDEAINVVLEACRDRFTAPAFAVERDDRGTIWVKDTEAARSIAVEPWLSRTHTVEQTIARVEGKLGIGG